MLAHGVLCRLAASKASARDLPQLARTLHRTLLSRDASGLPLRRALARAYTAAVTARRSYATTTTATKPTSTVKRAVKAQAAEKAPAKKRTTTAAATKTKGTTKARTTKKTAAASKAKPKAKKAAKKAAPPKKRGRKALTPEQVQKAQKKKEAARLTQLRRDCLREPVGFRGVNAYNAYVMEATAKGTGRGLIAEAAAKFKNLTPAELEHYNHVAGEMTKARQTEYRAWVLSHTPQQIYAANLARAQYRRLTAGTTKKKHPAHTDKILDDRQVKRQVNAYVVFTKERHASGDFKNIAIPEAGKLISQEWKALSAGEKKKYQDEQAKDHERYVREVAAAA